MILRTLRTSLFFASMLMFAGFSSASGTTLMHCFYFTPVAEASEADWAAFYKATKELPAKIDGLERTWAGKLRKRAAVADQVKLGRQYGVCMEMADEAALERYAAHSAHDAWVKVYEKVRVPGTTTFDIIGQ